MTSLAQPPSRKPFRLSRHKSKTEIPKAPKRPNGRPSDVPPTIKPSGGSRQKRPFDPSELSRRLEIHQRDQELAKALRKEAGEALEDSSPQDRTDSAHDELSKSDSASSNANSDEEGSIKSEKQQKSIPVSASGPTTEPPPLKRPEITKQPSRPRHDRRVSSSRGRRKPQGTYFPRYAAKQFSATTYPAPSPAPKKKSKKGESSRKADVSSYMTDLPKPKYAFEDFTFPKSFEPVVASEADIAAYKEWRGGLTVSTNPKTTRPGHLHAALDDLHIEDEQDYNPYMLHSTKHGGGQLNDYSGATQHATQEARPSLRYNDHRHDWSQASQCGDSARPMLHLHAQKRNDSPAPDGKAGSKRQQSPAESQTLIADAVKMVNKDRRRSSLLGFLKRHH